MRCHRSLVLASTLGALIGCSPVAHADRASPRIALATSPAKVRAPYDVQILRATGETLPTYAHRGRFYVAGDAGERYVIRITNPTPHRIEAVVTVDGLDVVDGEPGALRKRGYIVAPYGETRIEGFRTSQSNVATFRFSSVADSYAGKKGKARNVGVIAVALFEEERPRDQQLAVPRSEPYPHHYGPDEYESGARGRAEAADVPTSTPTSRTRIAPAKRSSSDSSAREAVRHAPPPPSAAAVTSGVGGYDGSPTPTPSRQRPGLGTEFGEQRYSASTFTRFVRAADRPIAIAELRYNDAAGLTALGIPVEPSPDEQELMTRETANPFPGDTRFARPPN